MAINKGTINFNSSLNVGAASPLDSRITVDYETDLYSTEFSNQMLYDGLIITVCYNNDNTPLGEAYILNNVSKLLNSTDINDKKSCFKKIASGDGLVWNNFPTTTTQEQGGETTT